MNVLNMQIILIFYFSNTTFCNTSLNVKPMFTTWPFEEDHDSNIWPEHLIFFGKGYPKVKRPFLDTTTININIKKGSLNFGIPSIETFFKNFIILFTTKGKYSLKWFYITKIIFPWNEIFFLRNNYYYTLISTFFL